MKLLLGSARSYRRPVEPEYRAAIDEAGARWPAEPTDYLNELD
ncbi:MAG: hypothetical protein ACRDMH_13150 [Solirubrobacterales bacterium]